MTNDRALERAEDYFERERAILLSGKLEDLAGLVEEREAVLAGISATEGDAARIRRLRDLAERNGALLLSASEGVGRAMKRLSELRKAAGPIGSYSESGSRCEIGSINPKFERKA